MAVSGLAVKITNAVLFSDKTLSVADTLEQATKALAAHREWMGRRVGLTSVHPDTLQEEECPKPKPASWALGTPSEDGKFRASSLLSLFFFFFFFFFFFNHNSPPPPPFSAAGQELQKGERSRVRKQTKVVPCDYSSTTGGKEEEEEEVWSAQEGRLQERSREHFYGSHGDSAVPPPSHQETREEGDHTKQRRLSGMKQPRSKKPPLSRSKVAPTQQGPESSSRSMPPGPLRPTSPEVFVVRGGGGGAQGWPSSRGEEEDEASLTSAGVKMAWGSQFSLDKEEEVESPSLGSKGEAGTGEGEEGGEREDEQQYLRESGLEGGVEEQYSREGGGLNEEGRAMEVVSNLYTLETEDPACGITVMNADMSPETDREQYSREKSSNQGTMGHVSSHVVSNLHTLNTQELHRRAVANYSSAMLPPAGEQGRETLAAAESSREGSLVTNGDTAVRAKHSSRNEKTSSQDQASKGGQSKQSPNIRSTASIREGSSVMNDDTLVRAKHSLKNEKKDQVTRHHQSSLKAKNTASIREGSSVTNDNTSPGVGSPPFTLPPSQRSNQSGTPYVDERDRLRSLQQGSSAKVVAVTPAPREQRTSYTAQGLSKLSLAEASGKLFDFEFDIGNARAPPLSDDLVKEAHWLGREKGSSVAALGPIRFINVEGGASTGEERGVSHPDDPGMLTGGTSEEEGEKGEVPLSEVGGGEFSDQGADVSSRSLREEALTKLGITSSKGRSILVAGRGGGHMTSPVNTPPRSYTDEDSRPSHRDLPSPSSSPLLSPAHKSGTTTSTSPKVRGNKLNTPRANQLTPLKGTEVTNILVGKGWHLDNFVCCYYMTICVYT